MGAPRLTMAVLMLSVFTVSMGFGIVLPALPFLLDTGIGGEATQVSRATGLLTGLYTFSLFLFAPTWGRLSDRHGRRDILLLGLLGFSATSLAFAFFESLPAIYAERFLSGLFAAAVTPVALATASDLAGSDTARARSLTFVSMAGVGGFLLGPMMGVFIARGATSLLPVLGNLGTLVVPLTVNALIALLVALAVIYFVPINSANRERFSLPSAFAIINAVEASEPNACLALEMFRISVAKQIAGMIVALGGIDTLIFTGGIGENDAVARAGIVERLSWCGIRLDGDHDRDGCNPRSAKNGQTTVLALKSREDDEIARHTRVLARGG